MSKVDDAINKERKRRDNAIKKAAIFAEAEAKLRSPVDTGQLRRSISHETESNENESKARIGTNTEYAIWVELGSSKTKAQPFLRPSIEENLDKLREIIRKELELK